MGELQVAMRLFLHWLRHAQPAPLRTEPETGSEASGSLGGLRFVAWARPLLPPADGAWERARTLLEAALAELPASYALWVPPGAALPTEEPGVSNLADLVRRTAVRLGQGERSFVPVPAELRLRKNSEQGAVVSVSGGLNPYWARFTDRVRGSYDLDSTELHRLPESEDHLEELLDAVVETSAKLAPGQTASINTIDAWTIQRLPEEGGRRSAPGRAGQGVTVLGIPPEAAADMGLAVRRNLRRLLAEAAPALRAAGAEVRCLALLGYYARIEQEGVTTAMRGYDPALFSGIDYICLVTDGLVKPIIQSPPQQPGK